MTSPVRHRRSPLAVVLVPFAVLLMLMEEYVWRGLKALMARLGRLPIVARVETKIAALPPFWAAVVFILPGLTVLPFKLAALWAIAQGHFLLGILVLIVAKLVATALVARLYTLCKPALMTVAWFVRVHDWVEGAKAWAHAKLESWGVWRLIRRAATLVRLKMHAVAKRWKGWFA